MAPPSLYYYADGKRIPLEVDAGHVAVDLLGAAQHGLEAFVGAVRPRMTALPGGRLAIVPSDTVTPATRAVLEQANAIHPVYRAAGARIVAFPEVRVHVSETRRAELLSTVGRSGIPADVVSGEGGDVVLRPKSGRGEDAIALANHVYESLRPEMSQPRFVRIVPRPDIRPETA